MKRLLYILMFLCLTISLFGLVGCVNQAEPEDMARHFEKNSQSIVRLNAYVSRLVPDTCVYDYWAELEGGSLICNCWHGYFNINQQQRDTLTRMLCDAKCIGFSCRAGEPIKILRARPNWFDLCWYELLPQPMTDEQWNDYLDNSSYLPYNDTVVFGYGGPSFGTDAMPERKKFIKKHRITRR